MLLLLPSTLVEMLFVIASALSLHTIIACQPLCSLSSSLWPSLVSFSRLSLSLSSDSLHHDSPLCYATFALCSFTSTNTPFLTFWFCVLFIYFSCLQNTLSSGAYCLFHALFHVHDSLLGALSIVSRALILSHVYISFHNALSKKISRLCLFLSSISFFCFESLASLYLLHSFLFALTPSPLSISCALSRPENLAYTRFDLFIIPNIHVVLSLSLFMPYLSLLHSFPFFLSLLFLFARSLVFPSRSACLSQVLTSFPHFSLASLTILLHLWAFSMKLFLSLLLSAPCAVSH